MTQQFILIGIDGGATKVSGWTIRADGENNLFDLGTVHIQKSYRDYPIFNPDFTPVSIPIQLEQMESRNIRLSPEEERQGMACMDACADVLIEIAAQFPEQPLLFGIGMPGLKTADKRGIAVLANGPRMPRFADIVEHRLKMAGVKIVSPLARLGSDADYCGMGEEFSGNGAFRAIENGYYLGGGTGVADALKLHGKLIPFDQAQSWLAKTWEMKCDKGKSLERYASANGIQALYCEFSGTSIQDLYQKKIYPDQILRMAIDGDAAARKTFEEVITYLAQLIFERVTTIHCGWQNLFSFVNPDRPIPTGKHPYLKTILDKIIIGQRLGDLFRVPNSNSLLRDPLIDHLSQAIEFSECLDGEAKSHYLIDNRFDGNRIVFSKLREAPALGAGIDAYFTFYSKLQSANRGNSQRT
ncbi:MAG: ROK family protein [FCB group bacterium]|nr:ROK family protein [FCB group bacterium]